MGMGMQTPTRLGRRLGLVLLGLVLVAVAGLGQNPAHAAGARPYFQLPFQLGQTWKAGAPHTNGGNNVGSRGSLDFGPTGTNKSVVAIAAGTVYRISCSGGSYLGVDHGNGWKSTYYHLTSQQTSLIGKRVAAGTVLGNAGRAVPCGGSASFDHVHLTVLRDGVPTNISGFLFGVYRVYSSGKDYYGYWNNLSGTRTLTVSGLATVGLKSTTQAITIDPTRWYVVKNRNSGKVVDVQGGATANGTVLQQYTANGSGAQKFRFIPTSGGYYQVQYNKSPSKVWEVGGGRILPGSGANIWSWGGAAHQQWRPHSSGSGWIEFRPRHAPTTCLDVRGGSTANSARLQIWGCNATAAQDFTLQ
jgi:Ricin-type beta-trefoil lectin domain-like/Peptidase family M23